MIAVRLLPIHTPRNEIRCLDRIVRGINRQDISRLSRPSWGSSFLQFQPHSINLVQEVLVSIKVENDILSLWYSYTTHSVVSAYGRNRSQVGMLLLGPSVIGTHYRRATKLHTAVLMFI